MWNLYDDLISEIDNDYKVEDLCVCGNYAYVTSQGHMGIAGIEYSDSVPPLYKNYTEGMSLKKLAECVKSWNLTEASIGLAAINAYYNSAKVAKRNGVISSDSSYVDDRRNDPFIMLQKEVKGKNVTVMRHFPYVESLFENICNLTIINPVNPLPGDYPATAYEFFLPESDFVFLESSSLINKSMPRMLELCSKAQRIIYVGPSVTLAPALFKYGITDLSGFFITNQEKAKRIIKGMEHGNLFSAGQKVSFEKYK